MQNHNNIHALWSDICALHEKTKSEHEEHYHLVIEKLNLFDILSHESDNDMYSRLHIYVEEVNGLRLTQFIQLDVVRKIINVLLIVKYGYIIIVLH